MIQSLHSEFSVLQVILVSLDYSDPKDVTMPTELPAYWWASNVSEFQRGFSVSWLKTQPCKMCH